MTPAGEEVRRGRRSCAPAPPPLHLDLGDYPLVVDRDRLTAIAAKIREFTPDVVLTHTDRDPFSPDHAEAFIAVERRERSRPVREQRARSAGRSAAEALPSSRTSPSSATHAHRVRRHHARIEQKRAAMAEMQTQAPTRVLRRTGRAARQAARGSSGNNAISSPRRSSA
jgi:LmbE family N-acetylglucosaminyl deacetylase